MKNIKKYIDNIEFEYAISFSGLRGEKFEDLKEENKKEIEKIEKEIESARFMQIPKLKKKIEDLNDEVNIYNSRIINKNGEFHKSTILIHRFGKDDDEIKEIFKILASKFDEQFFAMCPPTFRDSIVFYSKENEIKAILQICFGCLWMKNELEEDLEVDHKIFGTLRDKLIQIGHQIENE